MNILAKIFLLKILLITYLFACGKKKNVVQQINPAVDRNTEAQNPPNPLLSRFIPDGYSILDSASGNLNLDKYNDMIVILKKNNEAKLLKRKKRTQSAVHVGANDPRSIHSPPSSS